MLSDGQGEEKDFENRFDNSSFYDLTATTIHVRSGPKVIFVIRFIVKLCESQLRLNYSVTISLRIILLARSNIDVRSINAKYSSVVHFVICI